MRAPEGPRHPGLRPRAKVSSRRYACRSWIVASISQMHAHPERRIGAEGGQLRRIQHEARLGLDPDALCEQGEQKLALKQREVAADADARPPSERKVRKTRARFLRLRQEPVRIESLGVGPQCRPPVNGIGADENRGSLG